jgi:tetratricopeptide (TPR) repeat protein
MKAFFISIAILGFIFALVIPGIPKLCSWFELLAVNSFGMPFNTGYFAGLAFIALAIGAGIFFSYRKKRVWLYNLLICLSLFILGFSTYGVIILRSHDNPPIDMNNPEDPFALQYYLNRDQYEKRDLFYGPSFASPIIDSKEKSSYERFAGKYITLPLNPEYVYDRGSLMLFPRMASANAEHTEAYKQWVNIKGKPFIRTNQNGQQEEITLPTFGENLSFFFRYQLGFMYFRYLMWNFSGRQNDILGHGNTIHGNWITGIPFIDSLLVGPQDKLPTFMKNNPGRNTYYLLPFILGIIGIWYHYKTDKKSFLILTLLFFFTGIAIVIYLNEIPVVPRERDYVSVGSFYAFAIWIGLGVIGLWKLLEHKFKINSKTAVILTLAFSMSIPVIMVCQNWDDHDRSHRYGVLEYARNYLESCEPNAILFTNADNDTYPLWYAQEVEGIRRDIQIVLTPYLSAEWYANQMRKPSYNKPGLAMKLGPEKIAGGKRTYLPIIEKLDTAIDLNSLLDFVGSEDDNLQVMLTKGEKTNFVPSRKLYLPVDKDQMKNYAFKSGNTPVVADSLSIILKNNYITMDHLLMLDILASNHWRRPVYFASAQEPRILGLDKYLQLDGYAYKLTPYKTSPKAIDDIGVIDSETLYDKFMQQFSFASLTNPEVYLDNTHVGTISVIGLRSKFARLAETLLNEDKKDKALKVLDKILQILPNERISFDFQMVNIAELYARTGKEERAKQILNKLDAVTKENLDYFLEFPKEKLAGIDFEMRVNLYTLEEILKSANANHFEDIAANTGLYWKKMESTLIPALQKN